MQNNDMARKIRLEIDGTERVDLVSFGEMNLEQTTVEVPSFSILRTIITGVKIIPPIDFSYKYQRNTDTKKFLYDWFNNREVKDVVVVETDGTGVEIERWSMIECGMSKFNLEEYDASSPGYYKVNCTLLPYNIEEII